MSLVAERLRQHWLALGDEAPPGVSEEQLREFEARFGVRLPADMRDYFQHMGGRATEWMFFDDMFNFSPLGQMFPLSDHVHGLAVPSSYFVFADYSLHLPGFAIRLSSKNAASNHVIAYWCDEGKVIASVVAASFGEFVDKYLDEARLDELRTPYCFPRWLPDRVL